MAIVPIIISLIALGVSISGLVISTRRSAVDRQLQWEQLRGGVMSRLTSRGGELLTFIEELRRFPGDETVALIQKLVRIAEGVVDMRERLKRMGEPPLLSVSARITRFAPIKSDLDDTEPVFDMLRSEIMQSHFSRASTTADGLVQRLYGIGEKTPTTALEPTADSAVSSPKSAGSAESQSGGGSAFVRSAQK